MQVQIFSKGTEGTDYGERVEHEPIRRTWDGFDCYIQHLVGFLFCMWECFWLQCAGICRPLYLVNGGPTDQM